MSTVYNGKAGNESRQTPLSITGTATAAGLIEVTTAAHGLSTGDRVMIKGHGVVATAVGKEANGAWTVTVTSSTKFTLDGSTYVGNGGATGTATYLGLLPHTTIPADGDPLTAASIGVVCEDAKDSQAYLAERVGAYRFAQDFGNVIFAPAAPGVAYSTQSAPSAAWGTDTTIDGIIGTSYFDMEAGDSLEVDFMTAGNTSVATTSVGVRLAYEVVEYGAARTGTPTGALSAAGSLGDSSRSLYVRGVQTNIVTGRGKKVYIYVQMYGIGGVVVYVLLGTWQITGRVWRAN